VASLLQLLAFMKTRQALVRIGSLAVATLVLLGVFAAARLWFLSWGATPSDLDRQLPGDEIIPRTTHQGTRAIDIQASADRVWPWLAQTGQDRGGFHSYELLEDLVGCEMENLPYLDPALQLWTVGDKLWMYPPEKLGGAGHAVLMSIHPGHFLAFGTRQIGTPPSAPVNGSWSFIVEPLDGNRSRLIIRGRAAGGLALVPRLMTALVFDPAHFVMERRMMEVIKARAEGRPVSVVRDHVQVLLWTATFAVFLAAGIAMLLGRQPGRRLLVFTMSGFVLQLLTLTQPSPWLGAPLVLGLVAAAWLPRRLFAAARRGFALPPKSRRPATSAA
jgi:hypothetical protein